MAADRAAFSLTELLVAMTIAMMVMGAVASLFGVFGRAVSQSPGLVDLSGRMRSTAWQLRQDLAGVTADPVPWARPEANAGYFELLEGPRRDRNAGDGPTNLEADTDDILLFTARTIGQPFVGRFRFTEDLNGNGDLDEGEDLNANRVIDFQDQSIESDTAELAWFCRPLAPASQPLNGTTLYNLHRRQLLVVNYIGQSPFFAVRSGTACAVPISLLLSGNRQLYDLSLRLAGAGRVVPNTLADLTKRENRCFFPHPDEGAVFQIHGSTFPFALLSDGTTARMRPTATFDGTDRVWEDVLLTNVIAFDVRVFDPSAAGGGGSVGGYVDLPVANYDTWSLHYEFNGRDEDGDGLFDEGTDGVDNNGNGVPDDPAEYETSPPYPVPLRGIEVRIRCYDPTSRQVRQVTVRHSFVKK